VTLTLPERTLGLLAAVDRDRARAVVKVTDAALSIHAAPTTLVEVVEVAPGVGMILVGPSLSLRRIPWLRLVEVAPARFLLSIPSGTPVESLEIALHDLLEAVPPRDIRERTILEGLHALIRTLRRGRSVSKGEMLFVDTTETARATPATGDGARKPGKARARAGGSRPS
jgi:hypothetical protein